VTNTAEDGSIANAGSLDVFGAIFHGNIFMSGSITDSTNISTAKNSVNMGAVMIGRPIHFQIGGN
jgi:hypothetical protein